MSIISVNIYRSDIQVTFELDGHFRCLHVLCSNKTTFTNYCLTQWIPKLPGSFEIYWVRQYLVNITVPVGILNATVYKTEPIFTGLRPDKLSKLLTLHHNTSGVKMCWKVGKCLKIVQKCARCRGIPRAGYCVSFSLVSQIYPPNQSKLTHY